MKKRERERQEAASRTAAHPGSPESQVNGKWHLIAIKAYELYEKRGRTHGHDVEDWVEAEAIVNGKADEPGA
ncbi:MAG TPA: DUF2934 domain-containing protein [Nitrospira sp.]|nr:DUF2934 domain-containing protein [Nitrospira sp.]